MKSSSRNGARVIWIAVHTAEGARTVASLKAFFDRPDAQGSSHAACDDSALVEGWVPYDRAAWTLRNGNEESDNLEICGFASWSRDEWLRHPGILNNTARWIRSRCLARGIPIIKIGPGDVAARRAGVIGHVDYTNGTGDGTHWDPGPGFPWDVVMARAASGNFQEDDLLPDERTWLKGNADALGDYYEETGGETIGKGVADLKKLFWKGGSVTGSVDPNSLLGKVNAQAVKVQAVDARTSRIEEVLDEHTAALVDLANAVAALEVGGVDVEQLAALLAPALSNEADRRRRDGDPNTGPVS